MATETALIIAGVWIAAIVLILAVWHRWITAEPRRYGRRR